MPGGKTRGALEIASFIPSHVDVLYSPFFGGGSVELLCASRGIKVFGFDNFKPLVEFWQCLLQNPKKLAEIVSKYYPLSRSKFYELQKILPTFRSKYERAGIFYALNRASFSGITLSGGMSPGHPRFTISSIERLLNFKMNNITVQQADFGDSIRQARDHILYLDPPYLLDQRLYGKNGNMHINFDHKRLAEILHTRDNWILSYNNCEIIRELYNDYEIYYPTWKYGMSNNKESREVLICSHDIARWSK